MLGYMEFQGALSLIQIALLRCLYQARKLIAQKLMSSLPPTHTEWLRIVNNIREKIAHVRKGYAGKFEKIWKLWNEASSLTTRYWRRYTLILVSMVCVFFLFFLFSFLFLYFGGVNVWIFIVIWNCCDDIVWVVNVGREKKMFNKNYSKPRQCGMDFLENHEEDTKSN